MPKPFTILLGKAVRHAAVLRGGGSALPGLFVEKIDSTFVPRTLAKLPRGVVLVSGTNGKTTTTKMVVELLESQGLKVFTNRTGSNFIRGVAAALLGAVDVKGNLDANIAVLELDEAHAVKFVDIVKPNYSLLLNVMRDQLDRFGEIDATANMLRIIGRETTEAVIINREDSRLAPLAKEFEDKKVAFFGLDQSLRSQFPNDDELRSRDQKKALTIPPSASVVLKTLKENRATFTLDSVDHSVELKLKGVYNIYNAAAALCLVREIIGSSLDEAALLASLSDVQPAFGRGEQLIVDSQPLELVLVKNPAGFRLSLSSFPPKGYSTMIAINDNYADGRDMSWLWDVDFDSLQEGGVQAVTGIRAADMALRLQYDEIAIDLVEESIEKCLKQFLQSHKDQPKRIFCSYTTMLAIRKQLRKITDVEVIS